MIGNAPEKESDQLHTLHESLLSRYFELIVRNPKALKEVNEKQLAIYFEWLETLTLSSIQAFLERVKRGSLPLLRPNDNERESAPPQGFRKQFIERFEERLQEEIENQVKDGIISEEKKIDFRKIRLFSEFYGLKRKVLPMDMALVLPSDCEGWDKRVFGFIELDNPSTNKAGKKESMEGAVNDPVDRLKESLYSNYYKNVPVIRLNPVLVESNLDEEVDKIVKQLLMVVMEEQ